MKRKSRIFVWFIIFAGVVACVYRHMQPRIECYQVEELKFEVYDNDIMDADRLRALDCKYYKTVDGTDFFEYDTVKLEEDRDYGKSFKMYLPIKFKRKNVGDNFSLFFSVSYSDEAGECICIIRNPYTETGEALYDKKKEGNTGFYILGCTCGLDDETLVKLMNTLKVTVKIKDSDGKEWEEDVPLNMDKMTVEHEKLTEEVESPFFIDEEWFE